MVGSGSAPASQQAERLSVATMVLSETRDRDAAYSLVGLSEGEYGAP